MKWFSNHVFENFIWLCYFPSELLMRIIPYSSYTSLVITRYHDYDWLLVSTIYSHIWTPCPWARSAGAFFCRKRFPYFDIRAQKSISRRILPKAGGSSQYSIPWGRTDVEWLFHSPSNADVVTFVAHCMNESSQQVSPFFHSVGIFVSPYFTQTYDHVFNLCSRRGGGTSGLCSE